MTSMKQKWRHFLCITSLYSPESRRFLKNCIHYSAHFFLRRPHHASILRLDVDFPNMKLFSPEKSSSADLRKKWWMFHCLSEQHEQFLVTVGHNLDNTVLLCTGHYLMKQLPTIKSIGWNRRSIAPWTISRNGLNIYRTRLYARDNLDLYIGTVFFVVSVGIAVPRLLDQIFVTRGEQLL